MKQRVTVNKPWVTRREQQAIILASSSDRRALFQNDETVVLSVGTRLLSRVCSVCCTSADVDACFCGMCGNQL